MPRLVTLEQLLAETPHDNGANPLFDADSLDVSAGPTGQQVVIHAGGAAAIRKQVDALNPTHPEITIPAPKKNEPGEANTDYPLPSVQALAAAASSDGGVPDGRPAGLPHGATFDRPTSPSSTAGGSSRRKGSSSTPSQSPDSSSSSTYTATTHSDTPAAATSTTPDSAVTKTHEGQESSGIHPGEGAPRAATAAKKDAAAQEAEATTSGKAETATKPRPRPSSGAQPGDASTGQPARTKSSSRSK
jgi:hypothetical protein